MKIVILPQLSLLTFFLLLITSCGWHRHSYHDVVADITSSGSKVVCIATHDQRSYILTGKKSTTFVGTQTGGSILPIPSRTDFNVNTASNKPLATDMTQAITNSLEKKGYKTKPLIVDSSETVDSIVEKAKAAQADRLIVFTLFDWRSSGFYMTVLNYDVNLIIFDAAGQALVDIRLTEEKKLGGSLIAAIHAKKVIPEAFKEVVEKLMNSREVEGALQEEVGPADD